MTSNSTKHTLSLTLKIVLGLIGFILILGVSGIIFIQTEAGHEFARKMLNKGLGTQIRGTFELMHLDEIGFNRIVGRDLVIIAPNGEKVIELKQIHLTPVWSKLFVGKIEASSGTVTGGVVTIHESNHLLSINEALKSRPKPEGKKKGNPIPIAFNNIEGKGLQVKIKTDSLSFNIEGISSLVRFESADRKVVVNLAKTNGHADLPLVGDTKIRNLRGDIKSKVMQVLNFDLDIEMGKMIPAHIIYNVPKNEKKPGKPKMVIRFSKDNPPGFFSKLVLSTADALTQFLDVGYYE